jgi:hypothetical protein
VFSEVCGSEDPRVDASVLVESKAVSGDEIIARKNVRECVPAAMLVLALLSNLIALSPVGGRWNPVPAGHASLMPFVISPATLVVAAWACHRVRQVVGDLDVMLAVTIMIAAIPHPLLWALSAAPTGTMMSFVVVVISVLPGLLLGAASTELRALFVESSIDRFAINCVVIAVLGVLVPGALFWWSPRIWWTAPIWYVTFLSLVAAVAAISQDMPKDE